jgi:hypothetical protein
LLEESSLSVLMRPHGQHPPPDTPEIPPAFELFVRSFSPDDGLAQRLIEQIAAWDAAGRPATAGLHITAYLRDSDYAPSVNEVLIPKRWTQIVLAWE